MRRLARRPKSRFYVKEQLTGYHRETAQDIPYREEYLQFMLTERNLTTGTVENNLMRLKQFIRFVRKEYGMEIFDPIRILPIHIRRYLIYLKNERGNGPATRNGKLASLGSYYNFLECYEYIEEEHNPTSLIRKARVPSRLPVYLTLEEAKELLTVADASSQPERDIALLRVALQTGLRVGELVSLRVNDINFKERTLFVQGKGNRERMVPLTENTCGALHDYLKVRNPYLPQVRALFLNKWGIGMTGEQLNSTFRLLCQEAGLQKKGLTLRNLRHTCLTLLMQEGADLKALKKLAGHKSLRSTQIYLHVTQKQLKDAIKKHPLG